MSYSQNLSIQPYEAAENIGGRLFVAAAASGRRVRVATAATDRIIGVSERVGAQAGEMADVVEAGRYDLVAGGPIAFGDPITAGAGGRAVKAVAVNGQLVFTGGFARADAVAGDIFPAQVAPGLIG